MAGRTLSPSVDSNKNVFLLSGEARSPVVSSVNVSRDTGRSVEGADDISLGRQREDVHR